MTDSDAHQKLIAGARRWRWRRHGALRDRRPGFSVRRALLAGLSVLGGLAVLGVLAAGAFVLRLNQGPIAADWLAPRIKAALDERLKRGYSFDFGAAQLEKGENGPEVAVTALTLRDPKGRTLLTTPRAALAVDGLAAATGRIVPTRLELAGLDVQFAVGADGAISVSAGGGEGIALAQPLPGPAAAPPQAMAPQASPPAAPAPGSLGPLAAAGRAIKTMLDATSDPDNSLAALDHVSITKGRLVFNDAAAGVATVLDGLDLRFDQESAESRLDLSVNGPNGQWSLSAQSSGLPQQARTINVDLRDISPDEIALAFGARSRQIESDMPISATLAATMNGAGQLSAARIKFAAGAGYIKSTESAREPVLIDEITGALALDDSGQRLIVENLRFDAGKTHIEAHGTLTPPFDAAADWAIMLQADASTLGPERDSDAALAFDKGKLEARYTEAQRRLSVDRFEFQGPEAGVKLSAVLAGIGAQPSLKLEAALQRMPARVALRLWPAYAAPQTRAWFQEHLHGGTMESGAIKLDYDAATLVAALAKKPLPDAAGRFDFTISDGSIDTVPGLPPLTGVDGVGRVTGRTAVFTAGKAALELGGGRKLTVPDGSFSVKDYEVKPTPATLTLHVQAPMEAMSALLAREALKGLHALPAEAQAMKGLFDGQLTFDLKLAPKMGPDDMALRATANVTAMSIDNFIGKEKLENASLAVTYGREGVRAKGEGRAFGAPVSVDVKKPPGAVAEAVVSLNLDEAARARLGFSSGIGLTGPVLARLSGALSGGDEVKGRVELDLTKAAIDGLLPGWSKPAGKPGKISFNLAGGGEALKLSDIALEAGGVSFGGAAQLTPDGKFISARLTNMRLGPGEDMQAEVSQGADALKISLKGGSIDARPLLNALVSQQGEGRGPKDIDAELHANALIGHNKQSLANADVKLSRRGGQLRSLSATGRFGAQPLSVTLVKKDGPAVIVAHTQDAGAALSFLDLYRRMQGGTLDLTMKLGDGGRQDGAVSIKDFILKDEPAMQKLAANGVAPSGRDASQQAPLDPANVPFTKMTANFSRAGGRTDIRDGVLFGQQIGATISGSVDFARNSVDLNGAFVPAYEVNNLFARVPVLGPLLGGNKNEGLFAVNYRVTGPVSAPVLRVNPLSAIAPGFLRTIFGAVDGTRPPDGGHVGEAVALPAPGPTGR